MSVCFDKFAKPSRRGGTSHMGVRESQTDEEGVSGLGFVLQIALIVKVSTAKGLAHFASEAVVSFGFVAAPEDLCGHRQMRGGPGEVCRCDEILVGQPSRGVVWRRGWIQPVAELKAALPETPRTRLGADEIHPFLRAVPLTLEDFRVSV